MIKLYRYRPINEDSLNALALEKHWCAKPTTFNDPFEFRLKTPSEAVLNKIKGIQDIRNLNPHLDDASDVEIASIGKQYIQNQINNFGIVCFTETNDNILMWSHYSDKHQGICLGFEVENTDHAGIYKIDYSEDYPELDFSKLWHKEGMMKILWTKNENWYYEREWRMITTNGGKLEAYKGKLVEVIFGCNVTDKSKQDVKSVLANKDINFFDAKLDDGIFKINISTIIPRFPKSGDFGG